MRFSQLFVRAFMTAALVGTVIAPVPRAIAAVVPPHEALTADAIKQFLANPSALLDAHPNGGPEMVKRVHDLAASDPATLNALIGLLANANADQASAIGKALGEVAKLAAGNDPGYASQIQVSIILANNDSALVAYKAEVGGDIQLSAATGGLGGGGGGGGPTSQSGGFGGFFAGNQLPFTTSAVNTPDSFLTTSLGASATSVNTTTSLVTSVSP
jgi:hypothetical protein